MELNNGEGACARQLADTERIPMGLHDDEVLRVSNLSISFGGLKAVDNFSLSIRKKEIFGLIGPNGAGKTTVFNCITQFYRPDTGEVVFRTKQGRVVNLVGKKVHSIIKLGLVRTFQNVEIIREISVLDNLLVGAHAEYKTSAFSQILRLPAARREEKLMREKAAGILGILGISELQNQPAGGLSYGVLKKIELARTLISGPVLIILDEPAAGLDDTETLQLAGIIKDLRDRFNCAILLVEHDMRLVMGICDRVCAISFGKFLAAGTPEEIQNNPAVQEAYLGEEEKNV
jgi:branched-chain amino acid transport system ATP-binding protein